MFQSAFRFREPLSQDGRCPLGLSVAPEELRRILRWREMGQKRNPDALRGVLKARKTDLGYAAFHFMDMSEQKFRLRPQVLPINRRTQVRLDLPDGALCPADSGAP